MHGEVLEKNNIKHIITLTHNIYYVGRGQQETHLFINKWLKSVPKAEKLQNG